MSSDQLLDAVISHCCKQLSSDSVLVEAVHTQLTERCVPWTQVHTDVLTTDCQAKWMQSTDEEKYYQPHDGRYIRNGSETFYGEPVGSC